VRVELDGFRAFYEERGSGSPILLVHGLGGSTAIWRQAAGPLSESFRVAAYDVRGLGQSEAPAPPYSVEQLVADLHRLIEAVELEGLWLVGHSLGGAIALAFAAAHPELVRGVVGVAAPSVTPEAQRPMLVARAETALGDGMEAITEQHVLHGMPIAYREANRDEVATYRSIIAGSDPIGYAALCGVLETLDLRAQLGEIRAQALMIAGELDTIVPPAAVRATADAISVCEYVELDGCGHVVPFERPERLVELVGSFVARTS
jgi:3-oxoadipate enol-lactonase